MTAVPWGLRGRGLPVAKRGRDPLGVPGARSVIVQRCLPALHSLAPDSVPMFLSGRTAARGLQRAGVSRSGHRRKSVSA